MAEQLKCPTKTRWTTHVLLRNIGSLVRGSSGLLLLCQGWRKPLEPGLS